MAVSPPRYVREVLFTLQAHGHLSCIVGGCVRDMLLGKRPHDWDICTSARPEEMLRLFPHCVPTGIAHGTVTVILGAHALEVTTFRREGGYIDHRHPSAVQFVGDLNEDLSRRDFTVNAMAVTADNLFVDPFGGEKDLENRILRCVGDPDRRFEEDALRMLRALRFSARLGFAIEEETFAAISRKAELAKNLSAERVRDEIEKLLLTDSPETVYTALSLGLLDRYVRCRGEREDYLSFGGLPRKAAVRWCFFAQNLLRSGAISGTERFLSALRLDSRTIRCCTQAEELLQKGLPEEIPALKRLLSRYGNDSVLMAAQCAHSMGQPKPEKLLRTIRRSGECYRMKELAVSGDDLIALGYSGRELGELLSFLLDYVIDYPENNRREILLLLARHTEET